MSSDGISPTSPHGRNSPSTPKIDPSRPLVSGAETITTITLPIMRRATLTSDKKFTASRKARESSKTSKVTERFF
ncbi:MAG: hypothetical protein KGJ02_01495 [Verrucomicrobiota bacterium]|nr:hypothetical protein [Verrucomicrobiota bacterium]